MTKEDFATHLHSATQAAIDFTRTQCWNTLPADVEFIIRPDNLDENAPYLNDLEIRHFKERKSEIKSRFNAKEAIEKLWVDEQVPVWINMTVYKAGSQKTTIELLIDRRLRRESADIYHQQEGYPPFHILVSIPPYLLDKQGRFDGSKFNVNWQRWPWRIKWKRWIRWNQLVHRIKHGPRKLY
jgi:hypothetical protein